MNRFWKWLTHRGCPGCGHSRTSKLEKIVILGVYLALLTGILFTMQACDQATVPCTPTKSAPAPKPTVQYPLWDGTNQKYMGAPEVLYDGHIRSINWSDRTFVYESGWGFTKVIGRVCGDQMLPIWQNEHIFELNFHWENPNDANGCFVIDYIGHAVGVAGE